MREEDGANEMVPLLPVKQQLRVVPATVYYGYLGLNGCDTKFEGVKFFEPMRFHCGQKTNKLHKFLSCYFVNLHDRYVRSFKCEVIFLFLNKNAELTVTKSQAFLLCIIRDIEI